MLRVTLKLRDLPRFLIDIGKKSASRFTVETHCGNELIMLLNAPRPSFGIEFNPVIPLLHRRVRDEVTTVAFEFGHCGISLSLPSFSRLLKPRDSYQGIALAMPIILENPMPL